MTKWYNEEMTNKKTPLETSDANKFELMINVIDIFPYISI